MNKTDIILRQFNDIKEIIDNTSETLKSGHVTDITHIENMVVSLCEETLNLPKKEAVKVQPIMGEIISKLDTLANELKDFKTALQKAGK